MSTNAEERSIRVLPFSGKSSDWKIWSRKFLARSNRKGYKNLLLGKDIVPKESEYTLAIGEANAAEKKITKLWLLNEHAFEEILLSIEGQTSSGKVAFNLVDNCTTADQPDGNCKLAWDRLVNKYAPQTAPSYITLKKTFANSTLADATEDPDDWITELECMRTEMNKVTIGGKSDMTDVDVIIHVLSNLPEDYEVQVNELEEKLQDASVTVSIEDVRSKLNSRYARIQKNEESREEEKALAAFRKQFKGLCNKCGQYGHKSGDPKCPESDQNNQGGGTGQTNNSDQSTRIKGNCHYCGKYGHKKADCRKRKKDLANDAEKANAATDGAAGESDDDESIAELGLTAVDRLAEVRFDPLVEVITMTDHHDEQPNDVAEQNKRTSKIANEQALKCTIDGTQYPSFTKKSMYGDTACSCTITNTLEGMYDIEDIYEQIGGVGSNIVATKKGKLKCRAVQANGSSTNKVLDPVKYSVQTRERLLSITNEMSKGAKLGCDANNNIRLDYPDGSHIVFDRRIKTKDGWVAGVDIVPLVTEMAKLSEDKKTKAAKAAKSKVKSIDVNELHQALTHPSERVTRTTGKALNMKVTGTFKPCEDCLIGKAKRANISKAPATRATEPGERISIDISSPKPTSIGGKKHWLLAVDDYSDFSWSYFLKKKSELKDHIIGLIKELKAKHGISVKTIRLDNSGENNALEKLCKQEGLGIKFEYTAPGTPQQNGRVERKFQTLYGRFRSSLLGSGTKGAFKKRLWAEAANTATDMDNILVKQGKNESSFQQFFGKGVKSLVPNSFQKFGEMAVITNQQKIKAKLDDRGKTCIWLGYAKDHAVGTHRIYNPNTRKVILTRDVVFLRQSFGQYVSKDKSAESRVIENQNTIAEDDDEEAIPSLLRYVSDDESETESDENEMDGDIHEDEVVPTRQTTVNTKVLRAMKKLSTSYNEDADKVIEQLSRNTNTEAGRVNGENEISNFLMDIAMIAKGLPDISDEPKSFQEAYNHPDPIKRRKWREAIRKEFRDMIK